MSNNCPVCNCLEGEFHIDALHNPWKFSCNECDSAVPHSHEHMPQEAKHYDQDKTQLQWILSMPGLDDVAHVGAYGAKKYGQSNWRGGSEYMRYLGSVVRHVSCYIRGESLDKESGLSHLAHAAYNCLIILTWEKTGKGTDDRPSSNI